MYCDVVNVQPRFNFSDEIIILNLGMVHNVHKPYGLLLLGTREGVEGVPMRTSALPCAPTREDRRDRQAPQNN